MKNSQLLFAILLFWGLTLDAQSFDIDHLYPIEGSHSFVEFEVTYMGYAKVKGNFNDFYGTVYYNPEAPDQTSVTFQVEVESIDTNNEWRDNDLKSGNWFLAEAHPFIHFQSTKVEMVEKSFQVTGELTIKETTKSIEFQMPNPIGVVQDIRGDDQVIFTGAYTLNRKEYGVMGENWSKVKEGIVGIADEVTIEFSLLGKQFNLQNFGNFLRNPKRPPGGVYAAYQEAGLEDALDHYEKLQADTSLAVNSRTLNMVGYMLQLQEKYDDALVLLERNLTDFPEDSHVYNALGKLYSSMGQLDKAAFHFRKSLEFNPENMYAAEVLRHL